MDFDLLLRRIQDVIKMVLTGRIFKEISEVKSNIRAIAQDPHKLQRIEKEQNVKISFVIPTLNESRYIKNPILSLAGIPYHNIEFIIIDCMSEDDTVKEAKKFGAKVILSKQRNVGYQTHLGFMSAEGEIIVRTDADTIFPPDILTKIANTFRNQRTLLYHVGHLYYDGTFLLNLLAHLYDKYWRSIWATTGHFIAIRKSMYEKVAFNPLAQGQDYDFGKRVYEVFGHKVFVYDPNTRVLISSRAIRKRRLIKYILYQGSFKRR
jgi:glycosyltransferase involved in cell wall biosynthesis